MTKAEVADILKNHTERTEMLKTNIQNLKQERQYLIDDYFPSGVDYSMPHVNGNMNIEELKMAAIVDKIRSLDREIQISQRHLAEIDEVKRRLDNMSDLGADILRLYYYSSPRLTFEEIAEKLELSIRRVFDLRDQAIWRIISYESSI